MRALFLGMVAISIAAPACAGINLMKNASFESPKVPKGSFQRFEPGDKIGAWTVVGGPVELVSDTYTDGNFHFNAENGHQWLNLCADPGEHGGIQQRVHITALQNYELEVAVGSVFDPDGAYGNITKAKANVERTDAHTFSVKARRSSNGAQEWVRSGQLDFSFGASQWVTIEIDGMDLDKDCAIDAVYLDEF